MADINIRSYEIPIDLPQEAIDEAFRNIKKEHMERVSEKLTAANGDINPLDKYIVTDERKEIALDGMINATTALNNVAEALGIWGYDNEGRISPPIEECDLLAFIEETAKRKRTRGLYSSSVKSVKNAGSNVAESVSAAITGAQNTTREISLRWENVKNAVKGKK